MSVANKLKDEMRGQGDVDWQLIGADLDAKGFAVIPKLLTPVECQEISSMYPDDNIFRSRVVMAAHGFGRGEHKYFKYPLPERIGKLRSELYSELAKIANRWNADWSSTRHKFLDKPDSEILSMRRDFTAAFPATSQKLAASGFVDEKGRPFNPKSIRAMAEQ